MCYNTVFHLPCPRYFLKLLFLLLFIVAIDLGFFPMEVPFLIASCELLYADDLAAISLLFAVIVHVSNMLVIIIHTMICYAIDKLELLECCPTASPAVFESLPRCCFSNIAICVNVSKMTAMLIP